MYQIIVMIIILFSFFFVTCFCMGYSIYQQSKRSKKEKKEQATA